MFSASQYLNFQSIAVIVLSRLWPRKFKFSPEIGFSAHPEDFYIAGKMPVFIITFSILGQFRRQKRFNFLLLGFIILACIDTGIVSEAVCYASWSHPGAGQDGW